MWAWPTNMQYPFFSEPRPQWKIDLRKVIEKELGNIENEKEDDSRNDVQPTEEMKLTEDILAKLKKQLEEMSYRQLRILLAMANSIETAINEIGEQKIAGSSATVAGQSINSQSLVDLEENTSAAQPNLSSEKQTILEKELEVLKKDKTLLKKLEEQKPEEQLEQTVGSSAASKDQNEPMQTESVQGTETNLNKIAYDFFNQFWSKNEKQNKELKRDDNIENAVEATEDGQQMFDSDSYEELESLAHQTETQQEDIHKFETKTSSNEDVVKELKMNNELWKVDGFIKKLRDSEKYFPTEVKKIVENILRRNTKSSEKIRTSDIRDELQKLDMKQMEETFDLVLMIRFATQIFWRSEKSQDERVSTNMEYFANCLKTAEHDLKKIRQEELQEISNKIKFLKSPIKIFKKSIKQQMKAMESEQLEILQNMYSIFQLETDPQSHEKLGHQKPKPKPLNELLKRRSSAERGGATTSDLEEPADRIPSTLKKTPSERSTLSYNHNEVDLQNRNSKLFLPLNEANDSNATKQFIEQAAMKTSTWNQTSTSTSIEHAMKKVSVREDEKNEVSWTRSLDSSAYQEQNTFDMELERLKREYKEEEERKAQDRARNAKAIEEADLEFQQELERRKQEDEETFRKLQEEIDQYERETLRRQEEGTRR